MSLEIVSRTISSETEQRCKVLSETLGRTCRVGSLWTRVQVSIRFSTNRNSAWTGPPRFYLGMCNGTTAMPGSATPAHFIGIRNTSANWTWNSTYSYVGYEIEGCRIRNGGVESDNSWFAPTMNGGTPIILNSGTGRSVINLWLTRASATEIQIQPMLSTSDTPAAFDFSAAEFAATISESLAVPTAGSGRGYRGRVNYTSMDETTYGALNTMCFGWSDGTDGFELNDFVCRIVS